MRGSGWAQILRFSQDDHAGEGNDRAEKMDALNMSGMTEGRRVSMCGVGLGSDPSSELRMTMQGRKNDA